MKRLIFGALAFATGVYVERKYNVSGRVLEALTSLGQEEDLPSPEPEAADEETAEHQECDGCLPEQFE